MQHYNRSEAAVLCGALAKGLEGGFAAGCTAERDTQDSGEYGRVVVPAEATVCETRIVVCLSKFDSLALICPDNPGAFDRVEDVGSVTPDSRWPGGAAVGELGWGGMTGWRVESGWVGDTVGGRGLVGVVGVEIAVGYVCAWLVGKARRVGGRVDAEVDRGLDAGVERVHQVVSRALGGDSALERAAEEAEGGEVSVRTRRWSRMATGLRWAVTSMSGRRAGPSLRSASGM